MFPLNILPGQIKISPVASSEPKLSKQNMSFLWSFIFRFQDSVTESGSVEAHQIMFYKNIMN